MGKEQFFFPSIKTLSTNMKTVICLLLVAMLAGFCLSKSKEDNIHHVNQVAHVKAAKMSHLQEMSDLKKKMILRKQRAYAMKKGKRAAMQPRFAMPLDPIYPKELSEIVEEREED